jgi:homocysteine S-methyltransferase
VVLGGGNVDDSIYVCVLGEGMTLIQTIEARAPILAEGAVVERLRRMPAIALDQHVANASLLYSDTGRAALAELWGGYLGVAARSGMPMLLLTPTWRANSERLALAGLPDVSRVSSDAVVFLKDLARARAPRTRVWVGGLMGCRGDAYAPADALDARRASRFHAPQADALARAGVDVLVASTLPSASEAVGLARAAAATGAPYIMGFVLRPTGTLLDGTRIMDVVRRIDDTVPLAPLGYAGTCVHPECFALALESVAAEHPEIPRRFVAIQGNGSRLSPEELDGRAEVDADEPASFAVSTLEVHRRFGVSVLGGCCGTDDRHIAAIAAGLTAPGEIAPR